MKKIVLLFALLATSVISFNQVAINSTGAAPDNHAALDINYTDKGFLPPRLTTVQRDAITGNIPTGLTIYNTTTNCIEFFALGFWQSLGCASCPTPASPAEGTHTPSQTDITWNWNIVAGASGYKWNAMNDFNTASDAGNSTSYLQTGLSCGTSYTLYVWSYNGCGAHSAASTFTISTLSCPPFVCGTSSVNFLYMGNAVSYGTVPHNGECWLDRNIGALQVAASSTDANSFGDLFQWGRLSDGHQYRTSGTTLSQSSSDIPGHSNFIVIPSENPCCYNWRSPKNDNLWQGVNGISNPCPSGWRIPTNSEWDQERGSWPSQNATGAFASPLKLPTSGVRNGYTGAIFETDRGSYYSSDYLGDDTTYDLNFSGSWAIMNNYYRSFGRSVRCIKD